MNENKPEAPKYRKAQLLDRAIDAFAKATGLEIAVLDQEARMRDQTTGKQFRLDAILRIAGETYTAEVKAWA